MNRAPALTVKGSRRVAQPGSAHPWGGWGRRFESSRADHKTFRLKGDLGRFFYVLKGDGERIRTSDRQWRESVEAGPRSGFPPAAEAPCLRGVAEQEPALRAIHGGRGGWVLHRRKLEGELKPIPADHKTFRLKGDLGRFFYVLEWGGERILTSDRQWISCERIVPNEQRDSAH